MITTAPPLSRLTIIIWSLSCRSSRAFCSPFERVKYFGGFIYANSSLISLFVASINVSVAWCFLGGIHVLLVAFLNISSSVFVGFLSSL